MLELRLLLEAYTAMGKGGSSLRLTFTARELTLRPLTRVEAGRLERKVSVVSKWAVKAGKESWGDLCGAHCMRLRSCMRLATVM